MSNGMRTFVCPVCSVRVNTHLSTDTPLPHPYADRDLEFVLEQDFPDWKLPEHLAPDLRLACIPLKDILRFSIIRAFCPASAVTAEHARYMANNLRNGKLKLVFANIAGTCKASVLEVP